MNKYEMLHEDKIEIGSHTLYRIRALKDFGNVKTGDIGGYIEKEANLSQEGICWIYDNAKVYDSAKVFSNAKVYGSAWVCDNARVYDSVRIYDNAKVYGSAWVCDNARVCGNAMVYDRVRVYGNAWVYGSAWVCGDAWVCGNAKVCGSAKISKANDILCIAPIGSRNNTTTFFKTKDNNIGVNCGCFTGTIDDFLEAVNKTHGENKHAKAYKLACELARVQIELEDIRNERNII